MDGLMDMMMAQQGGQPGMASAGCPGCGYPLPPGAPGCPQCGMPAQPGMMPPQAQPQAAPAPIPMETIMALLGNPSEQAMMGQLKARQMR